MPFLSEAELELALMAQLRDLGWARVSDKDIGPDGGAPERGGHEVVIGVLRAGNIQRLDFEQPERTSASFPDTKGRKHRTQQVIG